MFVHVHATACDQDANILHNIVCACTNMSRDGSVMWEWCCTAMPTLFVWLYFATSLPCTIQVWYYTSKDCTCKLCMYVYMYVYNTTALCTCTTLYYRQIYGIS